MARATARGTVRAASRTSPLGTSATSMPANAKISSSDMRATSPAAGIAATCRLPGSMKNAPPMATRSERQQLGDGGDGVEAHAQRHAAQVHQRPEPEHDDQDGRLHARAGQRGHELAEARRQHRRDGGSGKRPRDPQQHAGQKARVGSERGADIGIRSARERHAAAGVRDAEHDEAHGDGAHQVGQRRGRAERAGDEGRQAKDAAADGDVDDACGKAQRADGTNQRFTLRPCLRSGHAA